MPSLRPPLVTFTRLSVGVMPVLTGLLWCAAAASAVWWFLQFPQGAARSAPVAWQAPAAAVTSSAQSTSPVAKALGGVVSVVEAAPEASRYQLLGVIASGSGQGSALIGVDGQPPKAYREGQSVAEGVVLQSLGARQARLGSAAHGPALFTLTLPGADKVP